jgi:hypothetical protein
MGSSSSEPAILKPEHGSDPGTLPHITKCSSAFACTGSCDSCEVFDRDVTVASHFF